MPSGALFTVKTGSAKYPLGSGPGAYIQDSEPKTAVISGSAFMSGTARGGRVARDMVPGPAYYSPAATSGGKKSYHLNARQRWMPAT